VAVPAAVYAVMRVLAFDSGLIVELAGAAASAAVLAGKVTDERPDARLIAIVSGRNVTADVVGDVLESTSRSSSAGLRYKSGSTRTQRERPYGALIAHASGDSTPVLHLDLGPRPGDVHVKGAWLHGTPTCTIKVAGSFAGASAAGLSPVQSPVQGLSLVVQATTASLTPNSSGAPIW
jgi:hypothetical protein